MKIDNKILTGRTEEHIHWLIPQKLGVHQEVVSPLEKLKAAAAEEGFQLEVCSGFRSFDSQLAIWNGKALGNRPIYDSQSQVIDISELTATEKVFSILRWSSLPGLSRHHWGTDLDIFDLKTLPENYKIQLIPSEFEGAGLFASMHDWLDNNLSRFGFFRPYATDLGGVSPERWHVSYQPLSQTFWKTLTLEELKSALYPITFELKEEVEKSLPQIYEKFFQRISNQ